MSFIRKSVFIPRSFVTGNLLKPRKILSRKTLQKQPWNNHWPHGAHGQTRSQTRLDYEYIESCKEVICRIPHPTWSQRHGYPKEFRLSLLRWSRGCYIDIRQYAGAQATSTGILLHLDVISALLPELITLVRAMEAEDIREPEQKAQVEVFYGPPEPGQRYGQQVS